mmetsp:Transcript_80172/g.192316  ORF Transcript_80172/g.192316 Transcript_80172/m.192316 type:complete len:264 (+) Transcript_80172:64-855(+)
MALTTIFLGLVGLLGASAESDCGDLRDMEAITCLWKVESTRCVDRKCEGCLGWQCAKCKEDTRLITSCCNKHSHSAKAPLVCRNAELAENVKSCMSIQCKGCSGVSCKLCQEGSETVSSCCSGDFHDAELPNECRSTTLPCAGLLGTEGLTCAWGEDVKTCMTDVCEGCSGEACQLCQEDTAKIMACCDRHRHSVNPPQICTDAVLSEDVKSCVAEKCSECKGKQCTSCKEDSQVLDKCCTEHHHGQEPPSLCKTTADKSILP